jgi:hypothetical protein
MAGPLTTEPFVPRLASKICGWDGFEGVAGFFFVFAMRCPGPASRQPLIVSNRPHRLNLLSRSDPGAADPGAARFRLDPCHDLLEFSGRLGTDSH